VEAGLKAGTVVQGVLRISTGNRNQAFVTVKGQGLRKDVFIDGDAARNRALPGDVVAVKLDDRSEWTVLPVVEAADVYDLAPASADEQRTAQALWQPLTFKAPAVDTAGDGGGGGGGGVLDDSTANPGEVLQACGRVVAIVNEEARPELVGSLQAPRDAPVGKQLPAKFNFVLFSPRDSRYPFLIISRTYVE
jgi:exoribonuclease R